MSLPGRQGPKPPIALDRLWPFGNLDEGQLFLMLKDGTGPELPFRWRIEQTLNSSKARSVEGEQGGYDCNALGPAVHTEVSSALG